MKCKYCRTEISEKALICSNCGRDIEAGEKRKEIPTDQPKRPEENQQSPAKKMNLATRIVLIIVAVAIGLGAGVGLATLVFGGPGTNADSVDYVQSNLNNGGDFAFVGGSIYYIGQDENGDSEDGQATCIMKKSENTAEKILAMDKMTYLNIYQDRIYFKRIEDKKSVIYSAKLDGSDVTELFREDRNLLNLSIASDKIYYITDGKLNRTDLLGQNKETILDGGVETYCVFDRYIYYSDGRNTYLWQKGRSEKLFGFPSRSFLPYGKFVYFINVDGGLAYMGTAGGSPITISEESIGNFTIWNDKIYYTRQLPQNELEQMAQLLYQYDQEQIEPGGTSVGHGEMYYRMLLIGSGPMYKMDLDGDSAEKIAGKDITRSFYSDGKKLLYTVKSMGEPDEVVEE